jgi:hypothetical protein
MEYNIPLLTCRKVNKGFSLVLDEYVVAKLEVVGDPGESMAPSEDDSWVPCTSCPG